MNPIKFFKRLSVTKKVMTISITLLIIGYIFCLPRQLFHVPYSTVVTDRNEELLGARGDNPIRHYEYRFTLFFTLRLLKPQIAHALLRT